MPRYLNYDIGSIVDSNNNYIVQSHYKPLNKIVFHGFYSDAYIYIYILKWIIGWPCLGLSIRVGGR